MFWVCKRIAVYYNCIMKWPFRIILNLLYIKNYSYKINDVLTSVVNSFLFLVKYFIIVFNKTTVNINLL